MLYHELRSRVYEANCALVTRGLVLQTFGNVSEYDREHGIIAIKPSGVEYAKLKPEDIVVLDINGKSIDGSMRPSSDTPTHLVLYRAFPQLSGIVHTHATYSTIFAQAKRPCICLGTTHADSFYGTIPITDDVTKQEIESGYETATGVVIVRAFQTQNLDPKSMPGVLVSSHGPFAFGNSALDAVDHAEIMEEICKMALSTLLLHQSIQPISQVLLDKHYLRKHSTQAYYGQPAAT